MHRVDQQSQQGFTLMEIMVAMMILAISLTVILQLFSGSLRSGQLSKNYLTAVYHAKAQMEEALLDDKTLVASEQGESGDGYTWVTTMLPYEDETVLDYSSGFAMYAVTVTVSWLENKHKKSVTLQSLRFLPVAKEGLFDSEE